MISTHSWVETLLGQSLARTLSTSISAEAPVKVSRPASLKEVNASSMVTSDALAAWYTSTGDKLCN